MSTSVKGGTLNVTQYFVMRLTADGTGKSGLTVTAFDLQYVRTLPANILKLHFE